MVKKFKNTNSLFFTALSLGLFLHILFLFIIPFSHDETCYLTIPVRLVNGESLVQHEWHLTQFASLFSYLPVRLWMAIKGNADGIFIFLRSIYLVVHTAVAVAIYKFFKNYGKWAVLASMMFYIQIPYRIQTLSYHSVFAIGLLLMTLCFLAIYKKNSAIYYIIAGACFGCCCVCNPLFCFAFVLYLLFCILWTKRDKFKDSIAERRASKIASGGKSSKKNKKAQKQQIIDELGDIEKYTCFFNKKAILMFLCGILVVALIAVIFFISTGGTFESVINNIENLLGSSEYDVASTSIFDKLKDTLTYFSKANFNIPFILPAILIALIFDKEKKTNSRRKIYLTVSLLWSVLFAAGVLLSANMYMCAVSLPFCVFSAVCYSLTENKNRPLFYCMFVPCLIATGFHYLAADTHLAVIGIVLAVSNVAGVLFVKDLWNEMQQEAEKNEEPSNFSWCRKIIIATICVQMLFYGIFYQYGQISRLSAVKATKGTYTGLYLSEEQTKIYNKTINDLDYIKSISGKDDPILIASYNNWMYVYLERPMATYSTWYRGTLDTRQLANYYKANPDMVPKYIYVESEDPTGPAARFGMETVGQMFDFTSEELSNGVLLTVTAIRYF